MSPRWRQGGSIALAVAAICGAWRCSSTPGGPEARQTLAYGTPLAAADPQPASPASSPAAAGICSADAPVICDNACCFSFAGCDDAGIAADAGYDAGCVGLSQPPGCSPSAPVVCSAAPDCDGGGCVAIDSSKNNNTGTLYGGAGFGDGRFGTALALNGAGSQMIAAANGFPDASAPFTVELWFKLPANGGGFAQYELFGDGLELNALPDGVQWGAFSGAGNPCKVSAAIVDGQWHFAGASWDPAADAGAVLVVDSAATSGACSSEPPSTFQLGVVIGQDMSGAIDEVRVLDLALDASALAADADAGPFTADAHTLGLWHFDEGVPTRCCPADTGCDPGGGCAAVGTPATCPSSAPVSCIDGCCPAGTTCAPGACAQETTVACPSSQPILCSDGTCCPSGYTCVAGGFCSIEAPPPAPDPACPAGDELSTPTECCPTGSSYDSVHHRCIEGSCPCPTGFTCQVLGTQIGPEAFCVAVPTTPLCSPTCAGGCCDLDAGQTCGITGCCNAATPACGSNPTCCDPSACDAGSCSQPNAPGTCPSDQTVCGDNCCGAGTTCVSGSCIVAQGQVEHICTNGSVCGDTCCGQGWSCLSPGNCGKPPVLSKCTAQFPNECGGGGPCCAPGCVCMGSSGGHQQATYCVCEGKPRGGPQGPRCPGGEFCDTGELCTSAGCCAADHPDACGSSCCLPGAPCTNGECGCPSDTLSCGDFCCGAGATCTNGACAPTCPADLPDPCGGACCAPGVTANPDADAGTSPFSCPNDGVACGIECCEPGGACDNASCACPANRPACGDLCCDPSQACVDGACQAPQSSGGSAFCYSTGACIPSVLSNSCECAGSASASECASGHPACSAAGGACNDNVHACCVGETCINSTCVDGCGQCAGIGCNP